MQSKRWPILKWIANVSLVELVVTADDDEEIKEDTTATIATATKEEETNAVREIQFFRSNGAETDSLGFKKHLSQGPEGEQS